MGEFKYRVGLFHGRFQHIHLAHQKVIDRMLEECELGILLIGNAQAQRTFKNPFNILERLDLIKRIYKDHPRLVIGFFPDLPKAPTTKAEYAQWGTWIIEFCKLWADNIPEVIYGGDDTKLEWLYVEYPQIELVKVPRKELPISATEIKDLLRRASKKEWEQFTDSRIHDQYNRLKNIVWSTLNNQ